MSLRVIGYRDGHPIHQDEGPGAARLLGHGGRMLLSGDLVTSNVRPMAPGALAILTPAETASRKRKQERKVAKRGEPQAMVSPERIALELAGVSDRRPRCGAPMRLSGMPCARLAGHADFHRGRASLDHDNAMRRADFPVARARTTRYNPSTGTSGNRIDSAPTPCHLLVPEGAASSRSEGRD